MYLHDTSNRWRYLIHRLLWKQFEAAQTVRRRRLFELIVKINNTDYCNNHKIFRENFFFSFNFPSSAIPDQPLENSLCGFGWRELRFPRFNFFQPVLNVGITKRHVRINGCIFKRFIIADPQGCIIDFFISPDS